MKRLILAGSLALAITSGIGAAPLIVNSSFESPDFSSGQFAYDPVGGAPWLFVSSGIGSAGNAGFFIPATPDGDQAAFIQGTGGSVSQQVSGFDVGSSYVLSFYLAKRTDGCPPCGATVGDLEISVLVDAATVFPALNAGTLTPGFHAFTSNPFVATAPTMTITFQGSGPAGDRTAFVDLVSLDTAGVPEPATFALGTLGIAGLAIARRFRRV